MNDRHLRYILTIVEEGNLTAAAQKLFISQPSLSSLLAHIEEELGAKLFDRSATPMALTFAGEEFVKCAYHILSTYDNMLQSLTDAKEGYAGRIKIGCGPRLSPYLIPRIIPGFMNAYPKIQIELFEYDKLTLEQKLTTGGLDIVITTLTNKGNKTIDYLPLYSEELMLVTERLVPAAPNKEGKKADSIDLRMFADKPFVLLKPAHQARKAVDKIFEDAGFVPRIILETDSSETCLRLVECGMADTILPIGGVSSSVLNEKVAIYSIGADYRRYLCLCLKKDAYHSKIIKAFYKHVSSVIGEI